VLAAVDSATHDAMTAAILRMMSPRPLNAFPGTILCHSLAVSASGYLLGSAAVPRHGFYSTYTVCAAVSSTKEEAEVLAPATAPDAEP
jgi:hypothetical protein